MEGNENKCQVCFGVWIMYWKQTDGNYDINSFTTYYSFLGIRQNLKTGKLLFLPRQVIFLTK